MIIKKLLIRYHRSYSFCFEAKVCPKVHGKWSYVVVSGSQNCCFSQRGIIRLFFSESWCSLRVNFKSSVIWWFEEWFIYGVVVHRQSCCVWFFRWNYRKKQKMEEGIRGKRAKGEYWKDRRDSFIVLQESLCFKGGSLWCLWEMVWL